MKNTKHTPGEWMIDSSNLTIVYSDENGQNVADCSTVRPDLENQANARLIAAAPELLEAALQMIIALDDAKERLAKSLQIRVAWDKLNNAIQKSTIS